MALLVTRHCGPVERGGLPHLESPSGGGPGGGGGGPVATSPTRPMLHPNHDPHVRFCPDPQWHAPWYVL